MSTKAAPHLATAPAPDAMPPPPWRIEAGALVLYLRVTPNAAADRIEGIETRADGSTVLRLRVRAVADRGKANAAVLALIAKTLGVPKSALALVSGETARLKTVRASADPEALIARLGALAQPATPPPRGP